MASATLSDLPLELFRAILAECIRVRSIERAFRLRLVNRRFATEVIQVVHDFRLLDNSDFIFERTGSFGISYMTRRLLNLKLPVSPKWGAIRRIASRLAAEDDKDGAEYERYIGILTTRAARYSYYATMSRVCQGHLEPGDDVDDSYSRIDPIIGAFGDPYLAAVSGGHFAALDILLRRLPTPRSIENVKVRILRYVAVHGSPSLIEKYMPEWPAKHLHFSNIREKLVDALATPSVENFKTIMRTVKTTPKPTLSSKELATMLERACGRPGWEDMVRYLISIGAPLNGEDVTDSIFDLYSWPLKSAAGLENSAIMQLLFQYGALVQGGGERVRGSEIEEAAENGRWESVRILVAHGADLDKALVPAVQKEREDIVRELVERSASLGRDVGAQALDVAKADGLESMVALLEELMTANRKEEKHQANSLRASS